MLKRVAVIINLIAFLNMASGQGGNMFLVADQPDCSNPHNSSFVCHNLRNWRESQRRNPVPMLSAAKSPGTIPAEGPSPETFELETNPDQCMDIPCLCSFLGGQIQPGTSNCQLPNNGGVVQRARRKEYRMLSNDERSRFHRALNRILQNGEFDRMARFHNSIPLMPGAHFGPSFVLWHREYLKRLEFALRMQDPSVSLPYWDSTLEDGLPNPAHSVMFTSELMGAGNNPVNVAATEWGAPPASWSVIRAVGGGQPYSYNDVNTWLNRRNIPDIFGAFDCNSPSSSALELGHNGVHGFIGGDMNFLSSAPRDPIFYLHHCFVDSIWEYWRQIFQNRNQRENEYANSRGVENCNAAQSYLLTTPMLPFGPPLFNVHGLRNAYTDNLFTYDPRPSCSRNNQNCGSRYLFCDTRPNARVVRCRSKIRPGGNCRGFESLGAAACYMGNCANGACISSRGLTPITNRTIAVPRPIPQLENCFNEDECCSEWAGRNECGRNPTFMRFWCRPACGVCHQNETIRSIDCADKHSHCQKWARIGACERYKNWMTENCRRTCQQCGKPRQCNIINPSLLITPPPPVTGQNQKLHPVFRNCPKETNSDGRCTNRNRCCQAWALRNECSRNPDWMRCNCAFSCGFCSPGGTFLVRKCIDNDRYCPQWASNGECMRNIWVRENCRQSCRSCSAIDELIEICNGPSPPKVMFDRRLSDQIQY